MVMVVNIRGDLGGKMPLGYTNHLSFSSFAADVILVDVYGIYDIFYVGHLVIVTCFLSEVLQ